VGRQKEQEPGSGAARPSEDASGHRAGPWLPRKRYWLLPMLVVLALFALLLVLGRQSSENFVYTLF